jgi:hypothetical protein
MPVSGSGSMASTTTCRLRRSNSWTSDGGCSNQSISPDCSAAAEVAGSVMTRHSTRSKRATFGPAVRLGCPTGDGT